MAFASSGILVGSSKMSAVTSWVSREKCAKVVHTAVGESWTMRYRLDLSHDLTNLAPCLSIKQG